MVESNRPNHADAALDGLRGRASAVLDDLALLRWRLGGVLAFLAIAGLIVFVSLRESSTPTPAEVEAARAKVGQSPTTVASYEANTPTDILVYASGAVKSSGVYRLPLDARVADVIDAAGGVTNDADLEQMNLAEKVADGQRVYVIRKGQTPPQGASSTSPSTDGVVNLNTATAEQLDALPGIGPATAEAIIAFRSEHGRFTSIDQLAEVKGIGPAKLAQLRSKVRV